MHSTTASICPKEELLILSSPYKTICVLDGTLADSFYHFDNRVDTPESKPVGTKFVQKKTDTSDLPRLADFKFLRCLMGIVYF